MAKTEDLGNSDQSKPPSPQESSPYRGNSELEIQRLLATGKVTPERVIAMAQDFQSRAAHAVPAESLVFSDRNAFERRLEQIAEGRRITLEHVMEALEALPGLRIERFQPSYEQAMRARELIFNDPEQCREIIETAEAMREATEGKAAPYIIDPLPSEIRINGEVRRFDLFMFDDIMTKSIIPAFDPEVHH